jgi:hypothetical protein
MTADQEKMLLNEIEDQRAFRAALARKVDRLETLLENALVQLCALHDRVDEFILLIPLAEPGKPKIKGIRDAK